MRIDRVLAAALALSSSLGAQSTMRSVTGTVFDSIGGGPLNGAVVQARSPDSGAKTFIAVTGADGRYLLAGLPAGRYAIGFQHRSLEAMGIESPIDAFELRADSALTMDLAIPSGAALRTMRCGPAADQGNGLLFGVIGSARQDSPVANARVTVEWTEVIGEGGKLRSVPRRASALTNDEGHYSICGVPPDLWLTTKVDAASHHMIVGPASVPPAGATRLDFDLVDSSTRTGTASLTGLVVREDRTRLPSGHATIPALGVDVPITNGTYIISGVPAGTWTLEAKAIGFEPHTSLVRLHDHATTADTMIITKKVQTLEAVNVIGKVGRDLRILDDVAARQLVASGTVFRPGNEFLDHASEPADVLRAARGFNQKSPKIVAVRGCGNGLQPQSGAIVYSSGKGNRGKGLAVYLDGFRVADGLEGLNNMVRPNEVLAIEAYPDVSSAPFLWRTNDACAVVAVWTKR